MIKLMNNYTIINVILKEELNTDLSDRADRVGEKEGRRFGLNAYPNKKNKKKATKGLYRSR